MKNHDTSVKDLIRFTEELNHNMGFLTLSKVVFKPYFENVFKELEKFPFFFTMLNLTNIWPTGGAFGRKGTCLRMSNILLLELNILTVQNELLLLFSKKKCRKSKPYRERKRTKQGLFSVLLFDRPFFLPKEFLRYTKRSYLSCSVY